MTSLEIRLLGEFQIVRAGESVAELPARIQAVLANVLLHRNAPRSRQQLAYTFWPESTDKQARANLRRLLLLLRRALPQTDDLLEITPKTVAWQPRIPVILNLATFEEGLSTAPPDGPQRRAALDSALDAYTGDLLPDCYDEWILPERERLRNAFAQALAELTLLAETERDYPVAIAYVRRLLRHDPLHEVSYRRLMRLLALTGDRAGALQTYHTCATLLRREVGVDPSPETQESYARLLHQQSSSDTALPPAQRESSEQLVGRNAEWQALQQAWRRSSRGAPHWVLITGEAGMGKSRLAEEMSAWAERQAIATAYARSYASTGGVSYSPLIDLLRNDSLRTGWEKLDDPWLVELSRLLPEIQTQRPDLPPPAPLTEEWQRHRLFEALGHAFLAESSPLLLVLDDLQWCDRESLEFLAFLLRFRPQARLLLVGTARSEEMLDNAPLQTVLSEVTAQGSLTQMPLTLLTAAETGQLAAQTGGVSLDGRIARRLHDDSGGNPLFVVEMVRAGDWGSGIGDWERGTGNVTTRPNP
jgi:DNA-binding SARP family transcriptional activator